MFGTCALAVKSGGQRTTCVSLSFYYLSSRDPTQVLGLGGNFPYPLSHLTSPFEEIPRTEPSTLWLLRKQKALYL